MEQALKDGGAINPKTPPRRCFHYTKRSIGRNIRWLWIFYMKLMEKVFRCIVFSFASYLLNKGMTLKEIKKLVFSPIVKIEESGIVKEVYLYDYLMGDSYQEAYKKISKIVKD